MENIHKHILFLLCCIVFVIGTCCATKPAGNPGRDVSDYQREINALESRIRIYELRVEQAGRALDRDIGELASVRERAQGMAGTVTEIADLFDLYTEAVDRILRDWGALQTALTVAGQNPSCASPDTGTENSGNGNGLCPVR